MVIKIKGASSESSDKWIDNAGKGSLEITMVYGRFSNLFGLKLSVLRSVL